MDNNKELKRSLTLFPCVMIMITSVIGSGIFTVPNEIMLAAQGSGTIFLAWILAGLCVFLMAMVYMELGPAMPQAGGGYIYLREAFGPKFAYFYGWGKMVNEVSVIALYAMAITNYIGYFFQLSPVTCKIVGTVIIVCAALFNIFGVKSGSGITSGLTVAKLLGLSVVIVGGLFLLKGSQSFEPVVSESVGWGGAIAAAVPAFFAFGGYNQLCYMSEEIKNPHKNLPRAIIIGLVSIVTVYILLTYVCIKALGVTGLAESTKAVASAASVIFGNVGGAIIAVCAIASILASINGMLLSTPRVAFSLARDGLYPYPVAKVHSKYGTPYVAIICYAVFATILLWLGSFGVLLGMCVFIARIMDVFVAASLAVLRKKRPDLQRNFKMKVYPYTLVIAIILCIVFAAQVAPKKMLLSVILCAIGVPVYFITQLVNKRHASKESQNG